MKTPIKKDTFFIITDGEYSDYGVHALAQALADIDLENLQAEFTEYKQECEAQYKKSLSALAWLINVKKLAVEIPFRELHVGCYDRTHFESYR